METAGIIIIGNEILSGKVTDINSPYLCKELRILGVEVQQIITIPDIPEIIGRTVLDFRSSSPGFLQVVESDLLMTI